MENENTLYREINILIVSKREGDYWDFKEKYHKNKADLLHDIICMANNRADKDGYIIFGISDDFEIKGIENDENRKNQQNIIDFVKGKKFSGEIRPTIELVSLPMDGTEIDVLIVKNSTDTPYFIIEDYNDGKRRVRANYIYTRIGDTNTDIDKSADINHIEYLWKKRFLLNRPPLEQIKQKLRFKNEWIREEAVYYNIYNPEFTVCLEDDDETGHPEFYSYLMMNTSTSYGMLKVKYFGTTLYKQQFVVLDGGRYITVVPKWGTIGDRYTKGNSYLYKFFVKDSMEHILHEFLFSEDDEAAFARDLLYSGVVMYEGDLEKEVFEDYLKQNLSLIRELVEVEKEKDSFDWMETEGKREKIVNQERILVGKIFIDLLNEFRSNISSREY